MGNLTVTHFTNPAPTSSVRDKNKFGCEPVNFMKKTAAYEALVICRKLYPWRYLAYEITKLKAAIYHETCLLMEIDPATPYFEV